MLYTHKEQTCAHIMYTSPKKFGPPNIKHLPTPLKHQQLSKQQLSKHVKNISSLQIQKMPRTRSMRASMRRPARGRGTPLTSTKATRGANRTAVERSSATVSPHAESLTSTDQPLSTLTLDQFLSMVREEVRAELQESQTQVIAQDSNMPNVLPQHQPAQRARELTTFCMCMCR